MSNIVIYTLKGTNGQLFIFTDHLEIERNGILAKLTHWDKTRHRISISYSEIAEIKFRTGILAISGYFHFRKRDFSKDCNLIDAARDDNCIVFRSYENNNAKKINTFLQDKIYYYSMQTPHYNY